MSWRHPDQHRCWPLRSLEVICAGDFALPEAAVSQVNSAWEAILRVEPMLFDGEMLHVERVDLQAGIVRCLRARYRHLAVRRAGVETGARALGVSGLIVSGGRVLLAQRAACVHLYPGKWELAPSGTVQPPAAEREGSSVDLVGCLLEELREETGLECSECEVEPFLLAYDATTRSYDACFVLWPTCAEADVHMADSEYSQFSWQTREEALALGQALIPVSHMMLCEFRGA